MSLQKRMVKDIPQIFSKILFNEDINPGTYYPAEIISSNSIRT